MKWSRAIAALVLVLLLVVVVTSTSSTLSTTLHATPCDASALSTPYSGPLKVQSVQSFGCEGRWAYLWATVGTGEHEIGVTEVLHYDAAGEWHNASRLTYCARHLIPAYVRFWGCNSN